MGGTKVTKTPMKKEAIRSSKMETVHSVPSSTNKQKRLYTQDLGAKLEIRNPSSSTFKVLYLLPVFYTSLFSQEVSADLVPM